MPTATEIRLSVVLDDLSALVDACTRVGWLITDTGERVTTEDGLDGEAVVVVQVPAALPRDTRFMEAIAR